MEATTTIVLILAALLAGAISPGPSFVLVARISMLYSRDDGIASAIGMGIGGAIYSLLALSGLLALLNSVPNLHLLLKLLGGLYLLWLGYRIWQK